MEITDLNDFYDGKIYLPSLPKLADHLLYDLFGLTFGLNKFYTDLDNHINNVVLRDSTKHNLIYSSIKNYLINFLNVGVSNMKKSRRRFSFSSDKETFNLLNYKDSDTQIFQLYRNNNLVLTSAFDSVNSFYFDSQIVNGFRKDKFSFRNYETSSPELVEVDYLGLNPNLISYSGVTKVDGFNCTRKIKRMVSDSYDDFNYLDLIKNRNYYFLFLLLRNDFLDTYDESLEFIRPYNEVLDLTDIFDKVSLSKKR